MTKNQNLLKNLKITKIKEKDESHLLRAVTAIKEKEKGKQIQNQNLTKGNLKNLAFLLKTRTKLQLLFSTSSIN